jgi:multiple sugar transport system permease protein
MTASLEPQRLPRPWSLADRLSGLRLREEQRAHALLLLSPTLLVAVGLVAFPLAYSLNLSVHGTADLPGQPGPFTGLTNWSRIAGDPVFSQSLVQTLVYVAGSCGAAVPLGLGAALVLNQEFPGRLVARACLLIPWAMPPVVVAAMFQWFLDTRRGLFGAWLTQLGVTGAPPVFFGGIPGTLFTLVGVHVWKTCPLLALMLLVALQYLPQEMVLAARTDGAGAWQRFRHVVLPYLWPTVAAAVVIELLLTLQLFDLIYALTLGGPGAYSTYNLYFYAYKTTFEYANFGYGAVLAYVVSALVIGAAIVLTRTRLRRAGWEG